MNKYISGFFFLLSFRFALNYSGCEFSVFLWKMCAEIVLVNKKWFEKK